ncbi:MAG: hypothetical protein R3245_04320, partial [Kiloniellales bacterium]|nr:hypothetical protein [Kiloniellales bacterium]
MVEFTASDYWKGIVLYGLNTATYKMALARCLLTFAKSGENLVQWDQLASSFYKEYRQRLLDHPMPQQAMRGRLTTLERIVKEETLGNINHSQAIENVASVLFNDVVPRFHTIGRDSEFAKNVFYETDFGKNLRLKDNLLLLGEKKFEELIDEVTSRWSLLEGAFSISQSQNQYILANDIRDIYLKEGYARTSLTPNKPFLEGYQG